MIRDAERRIANLTESLAKLGWSDAVAEKLRTEEATVSRLRSERSLATRRAARCDLPDVMAIQTYVKNLFAV